MEDIVFKADASVSIEELRKFGEQGQVVYNILTKYDTCDGYEGSVITVSTLDLAMEIIQKRFQEICLSWIKENELGEEDVANLRVGDDYYVGDTYAYFTLGDDYLSMYITANKIIDSM